MEDYVEEYLDYLRERKHRSINTISAYEQDIYQFLRYLQTEHINSLTKVSETVCKRYFLKLENEGSSTNTIIRKMTSLKGLFDYMIRKSYIAEDPTELLSAPAAKTKQSEPISPEEEKKLIWKGTEKRLAIRDYAIVCLLTNPGLSPAEIVKIKWEDVNFELHYLIVHGEKREKIHKLSEKTEKALADYSKQKQKSDSELVFPSSRGGEMSRQAIWKLVKKYGEQAGVMQLNPQKLKRK